MKSRIPTLIFAFCAYLLLASCSVGAAESEAQSLSKVASVIINSDMGEAIAGSDFATLQTNEDEIGAFEANFLQRQAELISVDASDLTEAELRRLGIWQLPNGNKTFWNLTLGYVSNYYRENGALPPSGADLYERLAEPDAEEYFAQMSAGEILEKYLHGLDPITGSFYKSFSSEVWMPGAMNITVVDDPVKVKELYPDTVMTNSVHGAESGDYRPVKEVWHIVIYGEREGSVILDTDVLM